MGLLDIAITGIKAHQQALNTTGHNITNASTEGYSRQEVVVAAASPLYRGFGYIGQGVEISTVRRVENQFLQTQLYADTSTYHNLQTYREQIEQVDRMLADDTTGLQPQFNAYFSALQGVADNPAYIPSRDVLQGEAQGLVDRFRTIAEYLADQDDVVNDQIGTTVAQVNSLAKGIAGLNEKIVTAFGSATREPPNDLLDARDELVRQLSERVDIDVLEVDNTYNISIGDGQALVMKNDSARLEAIPGLEDPFRTGIRYVSAVETVEITDKLNGGSLNGFIEFRNEALSLARNSLGRLAVAFTQQTNATHQMGIDLNGDYGNEFFKNLNDPDLARSRVFRYQTNESANDNYFSVFFDDPTELTTSDYELTIPGPENSRYAVIRKDDGAVVAEGGLDNEYPKNIKFDGLELVLESGIFAEGDSFIISPLRNVASDMEMLITQSSEIALAYPIRAITSLSNQGSGLIDQGTMLSNDTDILTAEANDLSPPLLIVFESESRYSVYDNTDPGKPKSMVPPMENLTFVPGANNKIFTDDPGETQVSSWRARLQEPVLHDDGPTDANIYNGINPERFHFYRVNDVTGEEEALPKISTGYGVSAEQIANQLNALNGVNAHAYTEMQVSYFTNSGATYNPDNNFEVWVNGFNLTETLTSTNQATYMDGYPVEVPNDMNPDFLAARINAHIDLQEMGLRAKSDGNTLTIIDENGDDIKIEMRGDKPQPVITGTPLLPVNDPANVNNYIDPGDTFMVSSGERYDVDVIKGNTQGLLNNLTGYDFSQDGPYEYEMYLPDGRLGKITLDESYATADDVKLAIAEKIQRQLDSPGQVEAFITETGKIEYQVYSKMSGSGNFDVAGMSIGGQVDITMEDGLRLETEPGAGSIFNGAPEAEKTYLGFQFSISGRPQAGDEFSIEWNDNGVSDNRNALDLVAVESNDIINANDGGMTLTEGYSKLVEQVGTLTNLAQIRSNSASAILEATTEELNDLRGVNLDEEAARLIEFQAAYNANARVISIAQELFDSLLAAF
jgi:flagellar hook-associated protein 1